MLFKPGSPLPLPTKTPGSPEDGVAKNENPDQLWFSALRGGRLFEDVSRRFQEMLYTNVAVSVATPVLDDVVFPSDPMWRDKIYMKMVERQRKSVAQRREWECDGDIMANTLHSEKPPKLHEWNLLPKKKPSKPVVCEQRDRIRANTTSSSPVKITWTVGDIAKAGCILSLPPVIVAFDDEQEMRRVYTLVYDVFRYKNILNEALSDVQFFFYYPDLKKDVPKVWLLLYDFYFRNFKPRETRIMEVVKALFNRAHLMTAENALAEQRVKLAAAVARLRIKHSALRLSELLPRHLKNEKMLGDNGESPVTCWINIRKTKDIEEVCSEIQGSLNIKYVEENNKLRPTVFKNDKFCPLFFVFDGSLRTQVAQSSMVRSGKLIMQDRSFCLGPATFGKLLDDLQLTGCVIQTHVNSPRTTAYLANLLSQNEKIKKLMAFSAGQRKQDYEKYFDELGVTNIVIYPEKFVDIPPDANYLEEVIAVFATPPNSYSAVTDPVDLVCSSGGDLTMLEILTESEESVKGRERVTQILEEQKRTLQYAMSRPQIQFVLYETHSELKVENEDMVKQSVMEMNRLAKLHHASVQRKGNPESSSEDILEMKEINNNERINVENVIPSENCDVSFVDLVDKKMIDMSECNEDVQFRDVIVPDCDIFDTPNLPDLCQNGDFCLQLSKEGCYLSLMQRKEIIHFDNKFMIQIAETRGLFGNPSLTTAKSKGNKSANKKKHDSTIAPTKFKRKAKPLEIERICAPTHSSAARNSKHTSEASTCTACPRNRHDPESHTTSSTSKEKPEDLPGISKIEKQWENYKKKYMKSADLLATKNIIRNLDKYSTPYFGILKKAIPATAFEKLNISPEFELFSLPCLIQPKRITVKAEKNKTQLSVITPETPKQECKSEGTEFWCYPDLVNKNPYKVMNSLTSEQIRRLISTSYNSMKNMDKIQKRLCTETKNEIPSRSRSVVEKDSEPWSQKDNTSVYPKCCACATRKQPKTGKCTRKFKTISPDKIVERLLKPTQSSLSRQVKQSDSTEKSRLGLIKKTFKCELCRKRNKFD